MTFKHKNCSIILDDGKGCVYKDGRLMFKGDGYIAIKFLLSFTDNAEEVKNYFGAQLNQREKCRWSKRDEEAKRDQKIKDEAQRAKESIQSKQTKKSSIKLKHNYRMTR